MERKQVPLRLTAESRAGWDAVGRRHNITLTALAEALGLAMRKNPRVVPAAVIEAAQQIDLERHSRR